MCGFKGPFRGTSKTQLARKINEGGLSFFLWPPASCGREQRALPRPPTPEAAAASRLPCPAALRIPPVSPGTAPQHPCACFEACVETAAGRESPLEGRGNGIFRDAT